MNPSHDSEFTSPKSALTLSLIVAAVACLFGGAIYFGVSVMREAPKEAPVLAAMPRHLDPEAIERIRSTLETAPGLLVEVGGISGDQGSLTLAAQLRSAFTGGVFKVRDLAEYKLPPTAPAGVSVLSHQELNQVLADAIVQIFKEVGQPSIQWIKEDLAGAESSSMPAPELKIIVGRAMVAGR